MNAQINSPLAGLSARELEIFRLLAAGNNTSEIAKRLSLAYKTVADSSKAIKRKLNVNSAVEIAQLAIEHDLADNVK